jgi:hypothetical protein
MGQANAFRIRLHHFVVFAAVLIACQPGFAGIFGKAPVPDWGMQANQTATPEYAKNSAAVILYHEYLVTIDDKGRAVERERKVVRILKPQGRDNSCFLSYDVDEKVNYFRAWTIAADQKQYMAADTDFLEVGDTRDAVMLSTEKLKVAHPPAIDVGATIVCESEEQVRPYMRQEFWGVQDEIPVVFLGVELDLPAGEKHWQSWHNYKPVDAVEVAPNHFRWEIKDVPALDLRDVPSHPEWEALAARMTVGWSDAAAESVDNQWKAIGAWMTQLEEDRPTPSPEITADAQSLIVGAPDFYTKLSRITESIQKNIRYFVVMRGIGGYQANHAADIYRNRYGDCKDKTTLLISMLQVAGIRGYYVMVDDRRGVVDPEAPSLAGNHMITAIEVPPDVQDPRLKAIVKGNNGKRYLIFDPTNQRVPVGILPEYEQGSYGTLAAGDASQVIALPVLPPDANSNEHTGKFTLAADGTLTGSVDTIRNGAGGGELRNVLKDSDEKERREALEMAVAHDVPGVVLNSLQFVQPSALDRPIEIHYKLTAAQYAHQAGPLLLVRPRVVGTLVRPFDDKPRKFAIDLGASGHWHDSFDIELPAGYVVDETPDPVDLDVGFATYHSTITAKDNQLHYERDLVVRKVELGANEAGVYRRLEGTILADEKGTAVLKKQ